MDNSVYSAEQTDAFAIMLGLLAGMQEVSGENVETVDLIEKDMHKAIYREKASFPEIYKSIRFNDDPTFPYSKQIEEALYELQVCGFLTRPNPTMAKYRLVNVKSYANQTLAGELRSELYAAAGRILEK